ncbi:hypothetical protein EJ02DRAFT_451388 [Clathrospora elynae]|uniref:Uncharacterized protein n=1 Tax=Clathrospora elynae TaxID=706981 RepID=A0A6A5T1X3_9PLEO|nr:hypothetical protein EJ02DRAFT_451388 [Clathrospora elynae]
MYGNERRQNWRFENPYAWNRGISPPRGPREEGRTFKYYEEEHCTVSHNPSFSGPSGPRMYANMATEDGGFAGSGLMPCGPQYPGEEYRPVSRMSSFSGPHMYANMATGDGSFAGSGLMPIGTQYPGEEYKPR